MFQKGILLCVVTSVIVAGSFMGTSIPNARAQNNEKVKNVIFMIPDGFSAAYATNYRWYKGKESLLDSMLVGMQRTYSANSEVTDSAAAATAMATGVKTNNGMISISPEGKKLKTILETAKENGKATGLVVTAAVTHATPAAFASHVKARTDQVHIAPQLLKHEVDVMLGGGKKYFPDSLLQEAKAKGYEYVDTKGQLTNVEQANKLIGLFAEEGLAPELERKLTKQPSLAEMSEKAIDVLKKDQDGFFLMIEGSQIDWAGHVHDAPWAMKDTEAFEAALQKVLEFAKKEKNTLVVVVGDHDTGGMSVGGYDTYDANIELLRSVTATGKFMVSKLNANRSNIKEVVKQYANLDLLDEEEKNIRAAGKPEIALNEVISKRALVGWTSFQHTGTDVPLYAFGPSANLFLGLHNNTDLPQLMAKAMNISFSPANLVH